MDHQRCGRRAGLTSVRFAPRAVAAFGVAVFLYLGSAEAQFKTDKIKPTSPVLMQILKVQEHSGEFAKWVRAKVVEEMETQPSFIMWENRLANIRVARWQLSGELIPPDNLSLSAPSTLAIGSCPTPAVGDRRPCRVDLSKHLPSSPPATPEDYFIRVVVFVKSQAQPLVTTSVTITYQRPSGKVTEFTAEGLEATVRQRHAWMYKNSPMNIRVDMNELYIGNNNEGADEPYLLVAVIYADGTTIDPRNLSSSTVRIDSPGQTHGNVRDEDAEGEDLKEGSTARIPNSTGCFDKTIEPIGLDLAAGLEDWDDKIGNAMKRSTAVYVVVVAMEKDETATSAADAARNAFADELATRVNGQLQSLTHQDLKAGNVKFDPQAIKEAVRKSAIGAGEDETLSDAWWFLGPLGGLIMFAQVVDPDDYIGAAHKSFSFGDLLDAGQKGIDFELHLANTNNWEGSYTVTGHIGQRGDLPDFVQE